MEKETCSLPTRKMEPIMLDLIRGIVKCQSGATAIEYGLIASLIVIAMMSALGTLATSSTGMWNKVSTNVVNAGK